MAQPRLSHLSYSDDVGADIIRPIKGRPPVALAQ